jgi:integrase
MPHLEHIELRELCPKDIRAWVKTLCEKDLAPRTQLHVYQTLKSMLSAAVREERITSNPCNLQKHELPKKRDKDLSWRAKAVFAREEIGMLISDERIPLIRRIFYATLFFAGARFGEVAALSWADLVPRELLPMLHIYKSFHTKSQTMTDTKSETAREVPVHPVLHRFLLDWREKGFKQVFGRAPREDDLVLPWPRTYGKGRRVGGPKVAWRSDSGWKRLNEDDLPLLGLRARSIHDTRGRSLTEGCGYNRPPSNPQCRYATESEFRTSGPYTRMRGNKTIRKPTGAQ